VATLDDVRRLALALPEVEEGTSYGNLAWKVKGKVFVWERPLRNRDRSDLGAAAPDGTVLAAKVQDEGAKQALLATEPDVVLTTPHFDGYPVVLVRLDAADQALLEELVVAAWLAQAPKRLAQMLEAGR
jgi:hypothetical protein